MIEALPKPTQSVFIAVKLLRAHPRLLLTRLVADALLTGLVLAARDAWDGFNWRVAVVAFAYVWLARCFVNAGFIGALAAQWTSGQGRYFDIGLSRLLRAANAQIATSAWVGLVVATQVVMGLVAWRADLALGAFGGAIATLCWISLSALQAWFTLRLWLAGNASIVLDQPLADAHAQTGEVLALRHGEARFAVTAWLALVLTALGELIVWMSWSLAATTDEGLITLLAPVLGAYVVALSQALAVVVLGCLRNVAPLGRAIVVSMPAME